VKRNSCALICYRGDYYDNIGDDIQALAALQFTKDPDYYIPIDEIGAFKTADSSNKVKAILNGWYTSNPDSWPPSPAITPLFISFYLSDHVFPGYPTPGPNAHRPATEVLLAAASKDYFKQHEPIGCRDLVTMERMKENGIDAYFSGCLTLTLESHGLERRDHIYIVDAECETHKLLKSAPGSVLKKIRFMTHTLSNAGKYTTKERLQIANTLVKTYETAALVVTSKLHCALPCLAFATPVVFLLPEIGRSRLPGLLELMHHCSAYDLDRSNFEIPWLNPMPNPVSIKNLAENLRSRCSTFIANDFGR
jgi:polysaccharide pyruvyl transferase